MPTSARKPAKMTPAAARPPRVTDPRGKRRGTFRLEEGLVASAVESVRNVLIARLDDLAAARLLPAAARYGLTPDDWLGLFREVQLALFPEEFGDGTPYTPDPAGRSETPGRFVQPKLDQGLLPLHCFGIGDVRAVAFARHLELGQGSPAAELTTPDGKPLFTPADLARLGERIERRGRAVG